VIKKNDKEKNGSKFGELSLNVWKKKIMWETKKQLPQPRGERPVDL